MPTTRKKVIKTVYKDENDSEPEESGDFSDSGSDAEISDHSSSEDEYAVSSGEEFVENEPRIRQGKKPIARRKVQYAKTFINKIRNESQEMDENGPAAPAFTVKDLTDADKLLPSFLNLSESDSSGDESPNRSMFSANTTVASVTSTNIADGEEDMIMEYQDVWSNNIPDNSKEIAEKTFKELEIHKAKFEETKASVLNYTAQTSSEDALDVKDLLAQGEEIILEPVRIKNKPKLNRRKVINSDSEMEDWEEVKESRTLPASGLQVVVDFPDAAVRKSRKIDIEMMMKRKINRVRKEYQVYMHKVHVLCWLGHGNYVSSVLNNQEIMSAVLSLVPSKECYQGKRVDMNYVEQIVKWFNSKITIKQDKNENKFKPKAPPLKEIMLKEIKNKVVSTKKYLVFIFVSMLRALGLQCRVMFNFVALPIKPPSSELCSLSTKVKNEKKDVNIKKKATKKPRFSKKSCAKKNSNKRISQLDGNDDSDSDMQVDETDYRDSHIMQVDGSDDGNVTAQKGITSRLTRSRKAAKNIDPDNEDVSPSKRSRKSLSYTFAKKKIHNMTHSKKPIKKNCETIKESVKTDTSKVPSSPSLKTLSLNRRKPAESDIEADPPKSVLLKPKLRQTRNTNKSETSKYVPQNPNKRRAPTRNGVNTPNVMVTDENNKSVSKTFIDNSGKSGKETPRYRRRSQTTNPKSIRNSSKDTVKSRSKSASAFEKSICLSNTEKTPVGDSKTAKKPSKVKSDTEDQLRVSHRGIKTKTKSTSKNYITVDLVDIIETRMSETKHVTGTSKVPSSSSLKTLSLNRRKPAESDTEANPTKSVAVKQKLRQTRNTNKSKTSEYVQQNPNKREAPTRNIVNTPNIMVTDANNKSVSNSFFDKSRKSGNEKPPYRTRSQTTNPKKSINSSKDTVRSRLKSASAIEKSKYFSNTEKTPVSDSKTAKKPSKVKSDQEDQLRMSHQALKAKSKSSPKKDVTANLIDSRMSETKHVTPNGKTVKGKSKMANKDDSDYQPEDAMSDEDFKPTKISPKIDRRVISADKAPRDKSDVWCEIFVEELDQWIAVDVVKGKVHCNNEIYSRATHPVCYVVGWDSKNYLKDLTRRYVPHWNTVTRKQRAEPAWWDQAVAPWRGPRTARDKEEDDCLDRMQLEAPLPKSIAEYKNHPLYALKRHLLKYEALYPPEAATLGFVRNEPVYARECVYTCHSRDTWLKEAKVVKLGEMPYKLVKARPKWDKFACKIYTPDKPVEIFGPWQVQDYEPPVAENGIVPRNAYGNVELFKECMLPKGTSHIKLPGLHRVAKKLNIDCAPVTTGIHFNGAWFRPVYDGYVVCKEFEEIITEAWLKDQENQERREHEKTEVRVYGNWKRLIKGLMIRERLKLKYGFEEPSTSENAKKSKGARVAKKKFS